MVSSTGELGSLVLAFSVTHIGLSAVRETVIEQVGIVMGRLNLVGRGLRLPSFWLADTSGLDVWPDEATAGRSHREVRDLLVDVREMEELQERLAEAEVERDEALARCRRRDAQLMELSILNMGSKKRRSPKAIFCKSG